MRTARWALMALAGLAVAIALTYGASTLSSQRIGLSSEPLAAGERLVPPQPPAPAPAPAPTRRPRRTRTPTPTTTTAPTTSAAPTSTATPPTGDGEGGDD